MTWRERIVAARERGRFTDEEKNLAKKWPTCAIGEQRVQFPDLIVERDDAIGRGRPADPVLEHIGDGEFDTSVIADNFDEAERLLDAIEDRVLELKRAQP